MSTFLRRVKLFCSVLACSTQLVALVVDGWLHADSCLSCVSPWWRLVVHYIYFWLSAVHNYCAVKTPCLTFVLRWRRQHDFGVVLFSLPILLSAMFGAEARDCCIMLLLQWLLLRDRAQGGRFMLIYFLQRGAWCEEVQLVLWLLLSMADCSWLCLFFAVVL